MFRITDFSGHFLGGEGGIKIKLTECTKYAESELIILFCQHTTYSYNSLVMSIQSSSLVYTSRIRKHWRRLLYVYG